MQKKFKFCLRKIFFEKRLVAYEIRFAVEKKEKRFLGQIFKIIWKICCVAIKTTPVIQFPYMGIV